MTVTTPPIERPPAPAPEEERRAGPSPRQLALRRRAAGGGRWLLAVTAALVIFCAFLVAKGAAPLEVLDSMRASALGDANSVGETLMRSLPLLLAALAVAVPARAGLFNIGGEGQLLLGAIGATGMAFALDGGAPTAVTLVLMAVAGAAAGALWAAIPAVLRVATGTNEAITSLLLNYVATIVLAWIVFGPWKDPASLGQAYSEQLTGPERLPILWGNRVHVGVVVALVAPLVLWAVFRWTPWGFKLRVLGGNAEAARRGGLRVGGLAVGAMLVGGALAGLGGMLEVAGVEGRLRPGMLVGFGFIGFLASWLARHHPVRIIGAATLLGAIAVGGNGLKFVSGLSGAAVNVLMALVLLGVLGWASKEVV
jgi:ABC-type uncharacterized transport system permease subunit